MSNKIVLFTSLIFILFTGCGGSSGSSTNTDDVGDQSNHSTDNIEKNTSFPFDEIKTLANNQKISIGIYGGNGVKYYKLIMPKKGNLIIDDLSTSGANLYDINLNLIEDNFHNEPITLEKGTYILKVRFYKNSNSSINLNF